jgi:hypothetical protein
MAQKANGNKAAVSEEEALIIHLRLSDGNSGSHEEREKIFKLEDAVIKKIENSGAGEYDGNEIGGGFFTMYMYGSSTERLWDLTSPIIKAFPTRTGSYAIKRYGKVGSKEDHIPL